MLYPVSSETLSLAFLVVSFHVADKPLGGGWEAPYRHQKGVADSVKIINFALSEMFKPPPAQCRSMLRLCSRSGNMFILIISSAVNIFCCNE